jgi:hypothetical protein
MIELLLMAGMVALGVAVLVGIVKLLFALLLLPFKAAIWLTKGLVGLVIVIPILIAVYLVATNIVPIVLFVMLLPFLLFVAGVALLLKLTF